MASRALSVLAVVGTMLPAAAHAQGRVESVVAQRMPHVREGLRRRLSRLLVERSREHGVDPILVLSVIETESSFNSAAVSVVGCKGLMQVSEVTSRWLIRRDVDLFDPFENVRVGVRYLSYLLRKFGSVEVALMAYNAGPGNVLSYMRRGRVPATVIEYVDRVIRARNRICASTGCV